MADPMLVLRSLFTALAALFASLALAFSSGAPSQAGESDDVLGSPQVEQVPEPDTLCPEPRFVGVVSNDDPGGEGGEGGPVEVGDVGQTRVPQDVGETTSTTEVQAPGEVCLPATLPSEEPTTPPAVEPEGPASPPTPTTEPTTAAPPTPTTEPTTAAPPPAAPPVPAPDEAAVPADGKTAREQSCENAGPGFRWDADAPNARLGNGATGVCQPAADAVAPAPAVPLSPAEPVDPAPISPAPISPAPGGPPVPVPGDFPGKYREQGPCEAAGYRWEVSSVPGSVPGANDLPYYHCVDPAVPR